jgi:cell division protein ZapA (FtsZ GTPase activity inhibitor)
MANELLFNILGTSFTIAADEDEAYLQDVLEQYRTAVENTQSISGINDPLNIAILTGFLLCDEINKIKRRNEGESVEVRERTMTLIAKLDDALQTAAQQAAAQQAAAQQTAFKIGDNG